MISLPEFRKLLSPAADALSDEEVGRIREAEYQLAEVIFEFWLRKKNSRASDMPPTQPR